jgi:hypothetical protein
MKLTGMTTVISQTSPIPWFLYWILQSPSTPLPDQYGALYLQVQGDPDVGLTTKSIQYRGKDYTDRAVRRNEHVFGRYPVRPSLPEEGLYLSLHKVITLPSSFSKYDEYEPSPAIQWNKTRGLPLTANRNSGERCVTCHHAKRSLKWSMVLAR